MQFYDWSTHFELFRDDPDSGAKNYEEFYAKLQYMALQEINDRTQQDPTFSAAPLCTVFNQASAELHWHRTTRAYYKLYPGIVRALLNTDVDIPCSLFHAPLPAILFRIPQDVEFPELERPGLKLQSILAFDVPGETTRHLDRPGEERDGRSITLWMDFGEESGRTPKGDRRVPAMSYRDLLIKDEEASLADEALLWTDTFDKKLSDGIQMDKELVISAIRLAIGACLLATNTDRVLEADVLNKHVARYRAAKSDKERGELHEKARRRGKFGWLMGREIDLPPVPRESMILGPDGHRLTHSHLRRGHFKRVRYGEKWSKTKVEWIRPTIVRPDLPETENPRGYVSK